jgi:protein involved in polysaccharide export with SLBB domain
LRAILRVFLSVICLAAAPLAAQTPTLERPVASPTATLSAGDMIRITVWRRPELSGDFQIALDGTIIHPLYKQILAAGVPTDVLNAHMRTFLLQFETNPEFVILPLFRVFIGGEVRVPSVLSVPPGTTLSQAISLAGGPTDDARLDQVRLVRGLSPRIFDLTAGDSTTAKFELGSNDQVVVTRRDRVFRDRVLPALTVLGSLGSLVNIILILSR